MEYKFYTSSGELYHWGIKGMKWGVRRYQNKDGSLTAAGKKRRAKLEGELEKLGGGKKSSSSGDSPDSGTKSVSEMSNKELQERTTRMQLEANYINAQRNLASMNPKQVSKGKQMAEKILKDSILPAVSKTTQSYLENYLKKTLGLDTKDELAELRRMADILDAKQRIDKHKNPDKYLSWDDKKKKREYDDETAKREQAAEEMRNYREYNEKYANSESYTDPRGNLHNTSGGEKTYTTYGGMSTYNRSRDNSNDSRSYNESQVKSKQGTVEGVGDNSSKKKASSTSGSTNTRPTVVDAEPYELMVVSNVPAATRDRGYNYIAGLLEEPKGLSRR